MPRYFFVLFIILIGAMALSITGCGAADSIPTPPPVETLDSEAYPSPAEDLDLQSDQAYPAPEESADQSETDADPYPGPELAASATAPPAYPESQPEGSEAGITIALDRPITPDDEEISGVGPPGLVVFLINITFMGEPIGSVVIDDDGTFRIPINGIEAGTRIGLVADVTTIGLEHEQIIPGPNEMAVPQVGYFYDSEVIR